jgi:uncharacterized protein YkwD
MKKRIQPLFNRWSQSVGALVLAVVMLCATLIPAPALARETYVQFVRRVTSSPPAGLQFRSDLEQVVAAAVNAYRKSKGVSSVGAAPALQAAARAHALDLAMNDEMGHTAFNGMGFDSRIRAIKGGPMFLPSMGENAARDRRKSAATADKARGLVKQWIESSGHRHNMISRSFTLVATGVVQKGNQIYAVQIFTGPEVKTNVKRINAAQDGGVY